jgi:hydroxyethylthiazole kinase-like uncharacterized protein yjeF
MKLLRQTELRALEDLHHDVAPSLMDRAGRAAAQFILHRFGQCRVLVVAGPGNNGGDAFVTARDLTRSGCQVSVLFRGDPDLLPNDARMAYESCRATSADFCGEFPEGEFSVVIDGLFGIGLTRPVEGDYATLVSRINEFPGPIVALDVPSGLDADTGTIHGCAVRATQTISFISAKPGLYTADGPDQCGEIIVMDLGLPLPTTPGALLTQEDFASSLKPRRRNSHKGSHGSLAIIGGATGMSGAALLAGRAALHLGAGRVFVGLLEPMAVDPMQPELMLRNAEDAISQATAAVIGPGLGTSGMALDTVRRLASADFPLLLDADALNLLAAHPVIGQTIARRRAPTLLTPHPAEAARLLGSSVIQIQANRIDSALELSRRFNAFVVLKGCGSVLARPDGRWRINTTGNPGLACAGTGDVLSGIAGALLAQGWPGWEALCAAVHLHGAATDACVADGLGPIGLTAGELIHPARALLNRWISELA